MDGIKSRETQLLVVNVLFALRILGGMGDTVECVITGGQFDKSAD